VLQTQSSRIPLTFRQRIFLTGLFLLALMLSCFFVSTIDPLASNLRLFPINRLQPGKKFNGGQDYSERSPSSGGLDIFVQP